MTAAMALPAALALLLGPLSVASGPASAVQYGTYSVLHYGGAGVYPRSWRCPRQATCYPHSQYYNPCCIEPPPPTVPPQPPTKPPPCPVVDPTPPPCPLVTDPPAPPPTKPPPCPVVDPTPPPCPLVTDPPAPPPTQPPPCPVVDPTPPPCPLVTDPPAPPPTEPPTPPPCPLVTNPPSPPPTCPFVTKPATLPPATPPPVTSPPPTPTLSWCDMYGQCGCPATQPVCPYAAAAAAAAGGARRRRSAQRKCYLNGHCPAGSSCCKNGCHGSKVCTASTPTPPAPRPHKVKVSVMLTSASRASLWFLTTYLYPFLDALRDHLDIELIAYGRVSQEGQCQFGLGDCLGNWLVSCAGEHLPGQEAHLAFATCLMAHPHLLQSYNFTSIASTAMKCARSFPSKTKALYRCGVGLEGYYLFKEAGRRQQQLAPSLTEVPTVAFDEGVVIGRNEDLSRFPGLLCDRLREAPLARAFCQQALHGR